MNIQHRICYSSLLLRPARKGVTLVEVLIAIGILAVGMLGAASMFPVGSYFMRKGEIADRGAAIAQAAFADLIARDGLNPEKWEIWAGGRYQPMGSRMRQWMIDNRASTTYQKGMNTDLGFVYIIDPLGTASGIRANPNGDRMLLSRAPYNANPLTEIDGTSGQPSNATEWNEFTGGWPVRRLTSIATDLGDTPSVPIAESLFASSDDLAFSVDDDDKPSQTRTIAFASMGNGIDDTPISREAKGDYSWMVSIAPTQSDAREALAFNPSAYYFDVSVVVFYKRALRSISESERLVHGEVLSTGTGGGEILLTKLLDGIGGSPFEELQQGQWVMVSGPHVASTPEEPLFFTQWYRVLAIDDEQRGQIDDAEKQRIVGLRGPDWPWSFGDSVRVGLFPGAVAVHTKTIRLESAGPYSVK